MPLICAAPSLRMPSKLPAPRRTLCLMIRPIPSIFCSRRVMEATDREMCVNLSECGSHTRPLLVSVKWVNNTRFMFWINFNWDSFVSNQLDCSVQLCQLTDSAQKTIAHVCIWWWDFIDSDRDTFKVCNLKLDVYFLFFVLLLPVNWYLLRT